ncbi:3-oxoacyl-reductase [Rhizodiscina lignyota]|uniref:3-oxoacyl-reductase n=1 Tax=Rhizodiscina lignyota TaxID=1504668 RepID=A0A9P4I638_9PEZI|nr:3-oxoacyl-reductase [Rhizodiscina lignyota]
MDVPGYAVITGGASGMGRECAKKFAFDGAAGVALLDLNASALESVKKEAESLSQNKDFKVVTHQLDVSNETEVNKVIDNVVQAFGRIDYVVNAAGVAFKHEGGAAFAETKDWKRVLEINLDGTFYVLRAAAKVMLKQDPIKSAIDGRELQRGSIVNFASVAGLTGIPTSTAYTASKHAVIGLTRTASEDYARQGLRINAVCPGYIDTPMTRSTPLIIKAMEERTKVWTPMGRAGKPEELADAVIFLSGGRSSFITGSAMVVDGGYTER